MDSGTIILLALVGLLCLAFVFLFATARNRDVDRAMETSEEAETSGERSLVLADGGRSVSGRELERSVALEQSRQTRSPSMAPPPLPAVPDEETLGVSRRQVLNRGIVGAMLLSITSFSGAMIAFLWPTLSGGFGDRIRVARKDEVLGQIAQTREPYYYAAGRFYLNPYPLEAVPEAEKVTAYGALMEGFEEGLVAIYQKCVHLGCRVPWCRTSQWFECPCHGSQYNRVGEKKGGPAPRGLDHFRVSVDRGVVVVDTGMVIPGPPIGTNTTGQESEGPNCIGSTEGGH
ncbi:MAG: Rieske 2Fe-2S domain-containing protein [Actinomycetota bacterium]|jgi:cytochrome b6-f complex iron-sulfur subunit